MRIFPRVTFAALAAVALLSGCVPTSPIVTPEPLPSSTPIFATEDDALAAATAAYAAYVKVSDQIFMEGGANPDRLKSVATGEQLKADVNGYRMAAAKNFHSTGGTTFESAALQQYSRSSDDGQAVVTIYLCEDISKVDVRDASGLSIVSPTRPNRVAYEVVFDEIPGKSNNLLVSHKEPWPGGSC